MRERVQELIRVAASLRNEMNFDEAKAVEAEIRETCFELDKRMIRVNELKRKMAECLLEGEFADSQMYDREANALLEQLKRDYGIAVDSEKDKQPDSTVSTGKKIK